MDRKIRDINFSRDGLRMELTGTARVPGESGWFMVDGIWYFHTPSAIYYPPTLNSGISKDLYCFNSSWEN